MRASFPKNLPIISTAELEALLACGRHTFSTRVYSKDPVRSPYSAERCAYFQVRLMHRSSDGDRLVGLDASSNTLYVRAEDRLIPVGALKLDLEPTTRLTLPVGQLPDILVEYLDRKGLLSQVIKYPQITIEEWRLKSKKTYLLTLLKQGADITFCFGPRPLKPFR